MQNMGIPEASPAVRTYDLILDACDEQMAIYGYRKMSMDDVARSAGVSKRTIYQYFPNKAELGLSSIGRVVEAVIAEMRMIAKSNLAPKEKLREILIRRVMGRVEQVQHYRHSLDELFEHVRPLYLARRAEFFAMETQVLQEVLLELLPSDEFLEQLAEALLTATNALLPYGLSPKELGTPDSIQRRLFALIDVLLVGVIPRSEI